MTPQQESALEQVENLLARNFSGFILAVEGRAAGPEFSRFIKGGSSNTALGLCERMHNHLVDECDSVGMQADDTEDGG